MDDQVSNPEKVKKIILYILLSYCFSKSSQGILFQYNRYYHSKVKLLLNAWKNSVRGSVYIFVQRFEKKIDAYRKAKPIFEDIIEDIKDFKER